MLAEKSERRCFRSSQVSKVKLPATFGNSCLTGIFGHPSVYGDGNTQLIRQYANRTTVNDVIAEGARGVTGKALFRGGPPKGRAAPFKGSS